MTAHLCSYKFVSKLARRLRGVLIPDCDTIPEYLPLHLLMGTKKTHQFVIFRLAQSRRRQPQQLPHISSFWFPTPSAIFFRGSTFQGILLHFAEGHAFFRFDWEKWN